MAAIVFVAFAAHVVAWVALPDHKIVKTEKAKDRVAEVRNTMYCQERSHVAVGVVFLGARVRP